MIFMDAAKGQYIHWLPDIRRLMAKGSVLISDNVLQEGDIIESHYLVERRKRTIYKRMREYLYELKHDPSLCNIHSSSGRWSYSQCETGVIIMRKIELLVPASSLEVLKIAVIFGADAVYIGGEAFGLRAKAKNFSHEDMKEGIEFAHRAWGKSICDCKYPGS